MNTVRIFGIILVLSQLFVSCEDLIDVDLNAADQRIVIEANLHNLGVGHTIQVSRTVPFDDARPNEVITDADVRVISGGGTTHRFVYSDTEQAYVNRSLMLREGRTYDLRVEVDGNLYEGRETMPALVSVDSVGMMREALFGDTYYFATLRFRDPAQTDNYYKYNVSVDGGPMRFFAVFSDKFNNGQNVTHQVGSTNNDITENSLVVVRRYCVSPSVFRYWNELQSTNPGSAAPANPTSNISNGALGYFGVSAAEDFSFDFSVYQEVNSNEEL